jgi:hypothetical protein
MRGIFIDIQRPLDSKLIDPLEVNSLGEAAVSLVNKLSKPRREFSIRSWDTLLQSQIEQIRNEIHAGRSTGVFFTDGDIWADITEPMFVANGNGIQKQIPLPVDNIFPSSCSFYDNGVLKTDWTIIRDPATVVFTAAPTGRITFTGKRKFRVVLTANDGSIFSESQLYRNEDDGVYNFQPLVFIEVEGVGRA